ncbi:MAG: hypothetical protein N3E48_03190 [Candidatus Bathyarchaeota archaeon]|nr:hypothetical protein [Candidatus Bathyarchaeota archaeon]
MDSLKKEFLGLLDKDLEFRYAVAGYLGLSEILKRLEKLEEGQTKIWGEIAKTWEEIARLREDFNRAFEHLNSRLSRVERSIEKISLDIEEEARIVVKYRLREIGYNIDVTSLILPELEINLYGTSNDICIVGEVSVRASLGVIDKINRRINELRSLYPDRLRPKIIKVVYTNLALPDLIEKAEKEGVWVLKATGDIVKPRNLLLK